MPGQSFGLLRQSCGLPGGNEQAAKLTAAGPKGVNKAVPPTKNPTHFEPQAKSRPAGHDSIHSILYSLTSAEAVGGDDKSHVSD